MGIYGGGGSGRVWVECEGYLLGLDVLRTRFARCHEEYYYFLSERLEYSCPPTGFRAKKSATPKNDAKAIQP
jgi:hypothetical protein